MSEKFKDRKSKAVSQAAYETKKLLDRKMRKKKLERELKDLEKDIAKVPLYERATSLILTMIADNPDKEWSVGTIWKELNAKADSGIKEYQNLFKPPEFSDGKTDEYSVYISKEDVEFIICRLIHHKYIWKSSFDLSREHFLGSLYKYNEVHWLCNKKTKQVLSVLGTVLTVLILVLIALGIPHNAFIQTISQNFHSIFLELGMALH